MTQISQVYEIAVAMDGTPQPLTIQPPGNVFSTWKALVIANNSGFVGVLQGVDDNFLSQPAIQPLTQDLYPYNNVRGSLTVVWPLGAVGGVPQPPTLTATFTDDPRVDFAGKSYPSPLATTTIVSVSDLYNPVPIQTTSGGGGGGLLDFGVYSASGYPDSGSPITTWEASSGTFPYVNDDSTTFAFPPDSVTIIESKLVVSSFTAEGSPSFVTFYLADSDSNVIDSEYGRAQTDSEGVFSLAPQIYFVYDTAGPFSSHPPTEIVTGRTNFPDFPVWLSFMSFTRPT